MTHITDRTSVLRAGLVVGLINLAALLAIKMALGQLARASRFLRNRAGFYGWSVVRSSRVGLAPLMEPLGLHYRT